MGLTAREIIRRPVDTEKGRILAEVNNTYMFEVNRDANKLQIKNAVERMFGVKVSDVRTQIVRGKWKRRGLKVGRRPNWKKAYVTLAEGDSISLFEGL